jgi:hypothetical protein
LKGWLKTYVEIVVSEGRNGTAPEFVWQELWTKFV